MSTNRAKRQEQKAVVYWRCALVFWLLYFFLGVILGNAFIIIWGLLLMGVCYFFIRINKGRLFGGGQSGKSWFKKENKNVDS